MSHMEVASFGSNLLAHSKMGFIVSRHENMMWVDGALELCIIMNMITWN